MENEEINFENEHFFDDIKEEKEICFDDDDLIFEKEIHEKEYYEAKDDSISIQFDDSLYEQKQRKKLNKEDLKTIPLPIFNCFYCANEKIAFQKLINDNLSQKYLYSFSKLDSNIINALIEFDLTKSNNFFKDNSIENYFYELLKEEVNKNSEYLNKYYNKSQLYLKDMFSNINLIKKKKKIIKKEIEKLNDSKILNELNLNDYKRKIKWEDISFEKEIFNIWDISNLSEIGNYEDSYYEKNKKNNKNYSDRVNLSFSYNENNSSTSTSNHSNKPFKNNNLSFSFFQH